MKVTRYICDMCRKEVNEQHKCISIDDFIGDFKADLMAPPSMRRDLCDNCIRKIMIKIDGSCVEQIEEAPITELKEEPEEAKEEKHLFTEEQCEEMMEKMNEMCEELKKSTDSESNSEPDPEQQESSKLESVIHDMLTPSLENVKVEVRRGYNDNPTLVDLIKKGYSDAKIFDMIAVPKVTIRDERSKLFKKKYPGLTKKEVVNRLFMAGKKPNEIANETFVSINSVYALISQSRDK